ncbi:DUF2922 domain-containing protein [Staphylococcus auricularis]|uniref:DUF2922 domain-containing protein n=1 Tax=Staphylococcus auricularis TaxID=29379 RepID=A0ABX5IH51_9STAP|nr:DUF2922 domain-containing protein [Staphylococcus auricularis]MCE5038778.1 DUF2922 domain-containing protein [Staphylococcus auricularis]PTH18210.1 DUF2922 domain-containing protein [Staphylococcus auricularis]PTH27035.1 DUF2922 domain-containing protein [Staphylococcus auricularis]
MNQTLELIFTDHTNKQIKLSLPNIITVPSETVVRDNMKALLDLDILRPTSGTPSRIHSAQLISKTTQTIFTNQPVHA